MLYYRVETRDRVTTTGSSHQNWAGDKKMSSSVMPRNNKNKFLSKKYLLSMLGDLHCFRCIIILLYPIYFIFYFLCADK